MTIYDEYAILEAKLKELEGRKDSLRVKILTEMVKKGEEAVETPVGKFSVVKLKRWQYPNKVIKLGEDFKEAKAKAESTGEATFSESEFLRFSSIKL